MMNRKYLTTLLLLAFPLLASAQNPVMKEVFPALSNGKLVGVSDYGSDTRLQVVDISIEDLSKMVRDYTNHFRSHGYQQLLSTIKRLEESNRRLVEDVDQLERKLKDQMSAMDALKRKMEDLERRLR